MNIHPRFHVPIFVINYHFFSCIVQSALGAILQQTNWWYDERDNKIPKEERFFKWEKSVCFFFLYACYEIVKQSYISHLFRVSDVDASVFNWIEHLWNLSEFVGTLPMSMAKEISWTKFYFDRVISWRSFYFLIHYVEKQMWSWCFITRLINLITDSSSRETTVGWFSLTYSIDKMMIFFLFQARVRVISSRSGKRTFAVRHRQGI